jgi:hypothetical protein
MAEEELQEMLFEPSIDSAKADQKIRDIQSLKGSLWTSFVEQLARIKTIIPPEQMKNLHDMRYHHNREKR